MLPKDGNLSWTTNRIMRIPFKPNWLRSKRVTIRPMATEARWPKMAQCLVKRLRESTEGHSHIQYLSDELLMEILLRFSTCKSIIQCKLVCKRWATLVSSPWFTTQFLDLKSGVDVPFAIVMWYELDIIRQLWQGFESFFKPSILSALDFSFSPFHGLRDDDGSATLVASCSDLVLYCRHNEKDKKCDYYISNVQTRQWVELPPPPYYYGRSLRFGLICDPFYSCGIHVNARYRYTVAVIRCTLKPSRKLIAHLFSSVNHCEGQWCDRVLSLPETCTPAGPTLGFCFDGKLYFRCREGIVGFDQNSVEFDNDIQCHLVKWPTDVGVCSYALRIGVSQGNLKVSYLGETATLQVWVLKDYKTSSWMLQHIVETREWVSRKSWMTQTLQMFNPHEHPMLPMRIYFLGFHPNRCNLIYLLVPGCIFLCNLSTRTLESACRIPFPVEQRFKRLLIRPYNILVMLPSWPTPLPSLSLGPIKIKDGVKPLIPG